MSNPGVVAVVGGGIAGSALSCLLARSGHEVHLFEKSQFPRDKLCGEFLSSEVGGLLQRLGCWSEIERAAPARIDRVRLTGPAGAQLRAPLPGAGLGLSRWALDSILFRAAEAAGAKAHTQTQVKEIVPEARGFVVRALERTARLDASPSSIECRVDLVVAAYGRRARLDYELGRAFTSAEHSHLGLKQHHRPRANPEGEALRAELEGTVELHSVDGGYCGLSFVEGGIVNVCALLEERLFRSFSVENLDRVWAELGRRNPALGARLAALEPDGSRPQTVARVPFATKERAKDGVLFLGDAAGMVAPLAGSGQAMALESAFLLAELLAARGVPRERAERAQLGRAWHRRWGSKYGPRMALGRRLQPLMLSGRAAERTLRFLAAAPFVTGALVRLTRSPAAPEPV